MLVSQNKFSGCHFKQHNSKQGRNFFFNFTPIFKFFTPAKINRHLPKLPKALLRQNILGVLFHNRTDISEPNSETHVIELPEERSPKICAIVLEQGTRYP